MLSIPIALHIPASELAALPPASSSAPRESDDPTPVQELISTTLASRLYTYVCLPLTTPKWKDRWSRMCLQPPLGAGPSTADGADGHAPGRDPAVEKEAEEWRLHPKFEREEVTVTRLEETYSLIGMVSAWLELDSPESGIRYDSELALRQELAYSTYLDVRTVVLPPPRNRANVADYARAINAILNDTSFGSYMQLAVRIPVSEVEHRGGSPSGLGPGRTLAESPGIKSPQIVVSPNAGEEGGLDSAWEMWDVIRTVCGYNSRLSIVLDLSPPFPLRLGAMDRWSAEPIRHIFLPATSFIPNAKGYPVLAKANQIFLKEVMQFLPIFILSKTQANLHNAGGSKGYAEYVRFLEKTSTTLQAMRTEGTLESFASTYMDRVQAPLQPLMDNLQSSTYAIFERDPVKYERYEEAIFQALSARVEQETSVICVAGAGRGPLIARAYKAVQRIEGANVTIYAIEKNPNALVTLQERNALEWENAVTLFFGDMRSVELPEKVDILISELLGSFGDNELSPECLDGAQRFLKDDGISIPSFYTAHVAPLSSSKLYNEVLHQTIGDETKNAETPYVVMFQATNVLSGDGGGVRGVCGTTVQECWSFEHPRRDLFVDARGLPFSNTHNTRSAHLTFHIPHSGVLHGLAGYFEAHLYGDVSLSIHPETKALKSNNMLSWFPFYFPLKDPLYLPANAELDVHLWRMTSRQKVWYEWYAESFLPVPTPSFPSALEFITPQNTGAPNTPRHGSTPIRPPRPSPMLDASPTAEGHPPFLEIGGRGELSRVKIGQTKLHNPGGRSSWIGL
ncbi:PRMT5-domain-containing protein [Calocera viscosa TUFC12733]|uniref:Protein arginine N-methyltransferase n=1 Tax=Calocera viscosa (strain TUFC12733) TaxID=1330018 RepID=A0A167GL27_CALVF|nr:PRMT5-domain-containing protein [Calocera viscosa TUFC12733]